MTGQPTDPTLQQMLIAEGVIAPKDAQIASIVTGMIQQVNRTVFSMRVEDVDVLVNLSRLILTEARKRNDPDIALYRKGYKAALAYSKYRREMQRLVKD